MTGSWPSSFFVCLGTETKLAKKERGQYPAILTEQTWAITQSYCLANRQLVSHCLVSNREGLGTSLKIMGLATIDPHSQKEHTEIYKIPKFGVNQASFD